MRHVIRCTWSKSLARRCGGNIPRLSHHLQYTRGLCDILRSPIWHREFKLQDICPADNKKPRNSNCNTRLCSIVYTHDRPCIDTSNPQIPRHVPSVPRALIPSVEQVSYAHDYSFTRTIGRVSLNPEGGLARVTTCDVILPAVHNKCMQFCRISPCVVDPGLLNQPAGQHHIRNWPYLYLHIHEKRSLHIRVLFNCTCSKRMGIRVKRFPALVSLLVVVIGVGGDIMATVAFWIIVDC